MTKVKLRPDICLLVFKNSVGLDKFLEMNTAVILLGSNTGELLQNLEKAISLITKKAGVIIKKSLTYETEPWGLADQPFYYNQVISINTNFEAAVLMKILLEIEIDLGRKRTKKWAPRIIDLDILYFNSAIVNEPGLIIPHPQLHNRKFTLVPLCEILPEMFHPILKHSNIQLLASVNDDLEVKPLNLISKPLSELLLKS